MNVCEAENGEMLVFFPFSYFAPFPNYVGDFVITFFDSWCRVKKQARKGAPAGADKVAGLTIVVNKCLIRFQSAGLQLVDCPTQLISFLSFCISLHLLDNHLGCNLNLEEQESFCHRFLVNLHNFELRRWLNDKIPRRRRGRVTTSFPGLDLFKFQLLTSANSTCQGRALSS